MQRLDNSLSKIGYVYSRKLKESNCQLIPETDAKCHYIDILVHDYEDRNSEKNSRLYEQFFKNIISSSPFDNHITQTISPKREFCENSERREYLIKEFIQTEANYLSSLKTFVSSIVNPLKQRTKDKNTAILGLYECAKIFMNINEIIQVTEDFYKDLMKFDPKTQSFGDLCSSHMGQFGCYNRYLLGIPDAHDLDKKKKIENPQYAEFVEKAKNIQDTGNQTVYDYLALPSQRVGRYTMYFKELLKLTPDDHKDLPGLIKALSKIEDVASIREDNHTQLLRIFRRLLQAIQSCPESLISVQRKLIGYLDTVEIDPQTLKPTQPITLFLFSDKIMVVKRPNWLADGLSLCGLSKRLNRDDFFIQKEAITGKMKFLGWISLDKIEFHYSSKNANHLKSFSLKGKKESAIGRNPDPTQRSLEAYFQSKHSFLISEHGEKNYRTNEKLHSYFIYQLGKAKNKINQSDELVRTTYYQWHNHHFFSNVYLSSKYHKVLNKSHTVLFYIEKDIEIESILKICEAKTIGFIVPHEKEEGYRFAIRSKLSSGCTDEVSVLSFQSNNQQQIENAQNQLFGNLYLCDKDNNKSLMPPEKTSSSIFSIIKEDPIRRKSKSAFKLFSSLTNHHPTLHQKQQKHKSMSDIQEKLIHDLSVKTPNKPRSKSASVPDPPYHTPSIKSHYSHESKLTLKSLATTKETQSQLYRMGTESSAIHQQRCFSPSFHPSRTASYEIQSVSRKKLAEEFSPKLDYIFTPSQSGSSNETTPSMIEPESESSSSLNSRSSSAISTFSHPYQLDPQQNIKIPTIQPERSKSDLLIPIASPEDMSFQKRLPFDYDLASIVEDKNRTINALTERLRKREEKILMLKADWYDSLRELGTVCDKFNSELQDIASMYEHHQKEPPDRPSNPSPDTQIQKKFETALIERNHWMLQATILKFQLKDQQTQQSYTRSYHRRSY